MQRLFALVVAFFFAAFILTACSRAAESAPKPEPARVAASPVQISTTAPTPQEDPATEEKNRAQRMSWANDPTRAALFEDYPEAGITVARALIGGAFGPTEKYNGAKTEWNPGQSGWGAIYANVGLNSTPNKPGAFAEVYWNTDGSVDWSRGVQGFSIDMGVRHFGIMYFPFEGYDSGTRHHVVLDQEPNSSDVRSITCFEYCLSGYAGLTYTNNATDLINTEVKAAASLAGNLHELTGE